MIIKLTCSCCGGATTYEPKSRDDRSAQDRAHLDLHRKDCAYENSRERLAWIAEHGAPVESEAVGEMQEAAG